MFSGGSLLLRASTVGEFRDSYSRVVGLRPFIQVTFFSASSLTSSSDMPSSRPNMREKAVRGVEIRAASATG